MSPIEVGSFKHATVETAGQQSQLSLEFVSDTAPPPAKAPAEPAAAPTKYPMPELESTSRAFLAITGKLFVGVDTAGERRMRVKKAAPELESDIAKIDVDADKRIRALNQEKKNHPEYKQAFENIIKAKESMEQMLKGFSPGDHPVALDLLVKHALAKDEDESKRTFEQLQNQFPKAAQVITHLKEVGTANDPVYHKLLALDDQIYLAGEYKAALRGLYANVLEEGGDTAGATKWRQQSTKMNEDAMNRVSPDFLIHPGE
jgi:hypothetical protein